MCWASSPVNATSGTRIHRLTARSTKCQRGEKVWCSLSIYEIVSVWCFPAVFTARLLTEINLPFAFCEMPTSDGNKVGLISWIGSFCHFVALLVPTSARSLLDFPIFCESSSYHVAFWHQFHRSNGFCCVPTQMMPTTLVMTCHMSVVTFPELASRCVILG